MTSQVSGQGPLWLSDEFIEKIMRISENDQSIKVKSFESKPATAKGDNYMSHIIRISVEYIRESSSQLITEKKSLICKIAPCEGQQGELVKNTRAFETEIDMMKDTLVKMNELLNEEDCRVSARVLYSRIGDPTFIIVEDLQAMGFVLADRQVGVDLEHSKLVMRRLGKFHASSVSVYEKDPDSIKRYEKGIFHQDNPESMKRLFDNGIKILGDELVNWTELEPWYSKKILKLSEEAYERLAEMAKPRDDEFNVLNHGDCWINNMLFRYNNEGKVIDQIFVDFQFSNWGPPALDIFHFISVSPLDEVLQNHRETLVEEYHKSLSETMSRLNCKTKIPSMEKLQKSLRDRELIGLIMASMGLPFMFTDGTECVELEVLMEENCDHVMSGYRKKAYRTIMVRRLKEWNSQGLLDS